MVFNSRWFQNVANSCRWRDGKMECSKIMSKCGSSNSSRWLAAVTVDLKIKASRPIISYGRGGFMTRWNSSKPWSGLLPAPIFVFATGAQPRKWSLILPTLLLHNLPQHLCCQLWRLFHWRTSNRAWVSGQSPQILAPFLICNLIQVLWGLKRNASVPQCVLLLLTPKQILQALQASAVG